MSSRELIYPFAYARPDRRYECFIERFPRFPQIVFSRERRECFLIGLENSTLPPLYEGDIYGCELRIRCSRLS